MKTTTTQQTQTTYIVYNDCLYRLQGSTLVQLDHKTKCILSDSVIDSILEELIIEDGIWFYDIDLAIEEVIECIYETEMLSDLDQEYRTQSIIEANAQEAWSRGFMGDYEQMIYGS